MTLNSKSFTWLLEPIRRFMNNSAFSGILLFSAAILSMIIANSPFSDQFHHFWETKFVVGFEDFNLNRSLHHWINDGLMSIFFFVVGLELKREIIAGELRNPKNAILPVVAAICGMLFPALIYMLFNSTGEASYGWGIPMATDIAFALGILYLFGDKVPVSLKVFLTTIAIVDDLGAVLVIAFFYTSEINFTSLSVAGGFLVLLAIANRLGVRNTLFYGLVGIIGIWVSFMMSGVHATISAVLLAFTIPARVKFTESKYISQMNFLMNKFKEAQTTNAPTVSEEQLEIIEKIKEVGKNAVTPLQSLEYYLHPLVAYFVMPIFALSNAGVALWQDSFIQIGNSVTMGVLVSLILGKFIGVVGSVLLLEKLNIAKLPREINTLHLVGVGFLAAIGFTMSLFIAELASQDRLFLLQAKLGILIASLISGLIGYFCIRAALQKKIEIALKHSETRA
ncbi:MAG: sodium/proton antiporter NhaA [Raineya sp.]